MTTQSRQVPNGRPRWATSSMDVSGSYFMSQELIVEHSSVDVLLFDRPDLPQLKVGVEIMQLVHSAPDADGVRTTTDPTVIIVEASNHGADSDSWDDYIPLSIEGAEQVAHAILDAVERVREAEGAR